LPFALQGQAAGKSMTQNCYSISKVRRTAAPAAAVHLALFALVAVAVARPAFATIDNTASAAGTYNGNPVVSNTAAVSVTVTPAAPAIVVTKVATPDTNVPAGTVVTYTYTVTNTGNQTLTNINLTDVHGGSGSPPVPANETLSTDVGTANDSTDATANDGIWSVLAPGDVVTFTASYTITQADVDLNQ
jgi:large repetitive protein